MILNITVAIWVTVMFILLPACSKRKNWQKLSAKKTLYQTCVLPELQHLYPTLV